MTDTIPRKYRLARLDPTRVVNEYYNCTPEYNALLPSLAVLAFNKQLMTLTRV